MVDFKDIWEDVLSETDLKKQDWLKPEASTLEGVMNEIQAGKKKRDKLWLFVLFGLALIVVSFLTFSKSTSNLWTESQQTNIEEKYDHSPLKEEIYIDNGLSVSDPTADPNQQLQLQPQQPDLPKPKVFASTIELNQARLSTNLYERRNGSEMSSKIGSNSSINWKNASPSVDGPSSLLIDEIVKPTQLASLLILDTTVPFLKSKSRDFVISNEMSTKSETNRLNGSIISILLGLNNSNLNLNPNYNFALEPADFFKESRIDHQIGLLYEKQLFQRWNLSLGLQYLSRSLNSGHNSDITYDLNNEIQEANNDFDLTLATPYGFMRSSHIISRTNDDVQSTTVLGSDFKSRHRTKELIFNASVSLNLLDHEAFSIAPLVGFSFNKVLSNQHELIVANTNHSAFEFTQSAIESPEIGLRTYYLSAIGGLDIRYELSARHQLGLLFLHREALTPLYEQDDYSSYSSSQEFNLIFGYKF